MLTHVIKICSGLSLCYADTRDKNMLRVRRSTDKAPHRGLIGSVINFNFHPQ